MTQTSASTPRIPLCPNLYGDEVTDYVCTLPRGHAGDCHYTDAMGICMVNADCRARRPGWGNNGIAHNHL